MLFSVVIPCFNEESYIEALLRSISIQSIDKKQLEIIVVDNGSLDLTQGVVRRFFEKHLSDSACILVDEKEKGVSRAKNTGANASSGEYIVFLDADNVVGEHFFRGLKAYIDSTGKLAGTFRLTSYTKWSLGRAVFFILEMIKVFLPRPFGKSFVKKEIFAKTEGFNSAIKLGENVDFLMRVKKICQTTAPNSFGHYKTHPLTCSNRRFRHQGYASVLWQWLLGYLRISESHYLTFDETVGKK